jgi:hypothetical protein
MEVKLQAVDAITPLKPDHSNSIPVLREPKLSLDKPHQALKPKAAVHPVEKIQLEVCFYLQ